MTNEHKQLIDTCLARGVVVTVRDVQRYLAAKKLLRAKPTDVHAQMVVDKFQKPLRDKLLTVAVDVFADFLLPYDEWLAVCGPMQLSLTLQTVPHRPSCKHSFLKRMSLPCGGRTAG